MSEDKPIKILSLLAPCAVLVCALYLFGYWSSFEINILEFVSLSDIIKLGVYPLVVSGGAAFIIGFLSGTTLPRHSYQGPKRRLRLVEESKSIRRLLSLQC